MPKQVERVVPIFGIHDLPNLVASKQVTLQSAIARGFFLDQHAWDDPTQEVVRTLKPRLISVDCLHGDGSSSLDTLQNIFLITPINPFELRNGGQDAFIVGGDICCASSLDPIAQYAFDLVIGDPMSFQLNFLVGMTDGVKRTNDLRNALMVVKLKDAVHLLPEEVFNEEPVAVVGDGHQYGKLPDVWESAETQRDCLTSNLKRLFEVAYSAIKRQGILPDTKTRDRFVKGFGQMIGTLDIWRISEATSLSVEEVRRNMILEISVISPTFAQIASEVGENTPSQ